MKFHLSLYDPSYAAAKGRCWTWHAPELSTSLLDEFFYNIACPQQPQKPNLLKPHQLWGGVAKFNAEWLVVYRFADGGYERSGRPGRYVLMAGFARAAEVEAFDFMEALRNPIFQQIAETAVVTIPVPPPDPLELALASTRLQPSSSSDAERPFRSKRSFPGPHALAKAAQFCAALSCGQTWHCTIAPGADTLEPVVEVELLGGAKTSLSGSVAFVAHSRSTLAVAMSRDKLEPDVSRRQTRKQQSLGLPRQLKRRREFFAGLALGALLGAAAALGAVAIFSFQGVGSPAIDRELKTPPPGMQNRPFDALHRDEPLDQLHHEIPPIGGMSQPISSSRQSPPSQPPASPTTPVPHHADD